MSVIVPVKIPKELSANSAPFVTGGEVLIPRCATALVTGFVAFELTTELAAYSACFVLNLPVENLPSGRDAAVLRTIVANREGFLRYLLLLSQDSEGVPTVPDLEQLALAVRS